MATRKLTQHFVDTVKAGAADAFYWHAERIQQGARLGLKVTPTGRRVFVVQYRPIGGRRDSVRRLTLSATDLRGAQQEARALFQAHRDPARERQAERLAETVAEALPLFLAELAGKKKARTLYEWTRILGGTHGGVSHAGYVLPTLGALRVRDVEPNDVARVHRRVWNGAETKRPVMANRVLGALSAFFAWCEARGYRARGTNPTRGVERFPETERERFLAPEELVRLSHVLREAETTGLRTATQLRKAATNPATQKHRPKNADAPRVADPVAVAALRFLLFSAFREQEALSLRWDAVDFASGFVTLGDSKTGKSVRPVSAHALQIVAALPREGDYVFPGAGEGQPRKEIKRLWYAVREAAGLEGVRLHDLRHTVASFAISGGSTLPMVAALLGHKDLKSTQRYAHLFDEAKRATADRAAGDMHAAMEGASTTPCFLQVAR